MGTQRVVAIIEARMTSSRLPGKHLIEAGGLPFIGHLIRRLKAVPSLDQIVLATTQNATDDILVQVVQDFGIPCFRGSENDVQDRVIGAGENFNADIIVEITGDCPVIDPEIVEQSIRTYMANSASFVTNAHIRSYPDGMDAQVFPLSALVKSKQLSNDPGDREHVTLFMRRNPHIFPPIHLVAPPSLYWPELGLTLDESADVKLLTKIVEYFGLDRPLFSCCDIVRALRNNPSWLDLNAHVNRRIIN